MKPGQVTASEALIIERRREMVGRLARNGLTIRAIVIALKASNKTEGPWTANGAAPARTTVNDDILALKADCHANATRETAEYIAEQLDIQRHVQTNALRDDNGELALKASDRITKLLGLNAPDRKEVSGPGGGPIHTATAIDLDTLPLEHLQALREIRQAIEDKATKTARDD